MSAIEVRIGQNIRAIRVAGGINQETLADRCTDIRARFGLRGSWTQPTLSEAETGRRATFDLLDLLVLSEALDCTLNDLFAGVSPHADHIIDSMRASLERIAGNEAQ